MCKFHLEDMCDYLSEISVLFKKYGVKSITMDDIARELGVSKKTLYQHFENKNDVVFKIVQFEIQNECEELSRLCTRLDGAIDQLLLISKYIVKKNFSIASYVLFGMNKYYPQIMAEMMDKRRDSYLSIIQNNIRLGIEEGCYREDINTGIFLIYYLFLLDIRNVEKYSGWLTEDPETMFNTIFQYHIRVIANSAGIEYLEKNIGVLGSAGWLT